MKKVLLIAFIFFAYMSLSAQTQAPSIEWAKCYGGSSSDYANSIIETKDGDYTVAGYSESDNNDVTNNHGYGDYWIIKIHHSGELLWQKCLGGFATECANSIIETKDSGYIVAGYTYSDDGDVTGKHGNAYYQDYLIEKLDYSGELLWQKCLGGSNSDEAKSIIETKDGDYIVAGYSESDNNDVTNNHGYGDYWIAKLNQSGELQWQKCLGGSDYDIANSVIETKDGGYIVAGCSFSNDGNVKGHRNNGDYWIVKLNQTGELLWQKCLGGSGDDEAYSIIESKDGGYIVAGCSFSNDGNVIGFPRKKDYWIVKLNQTGELLWQKCLGGSRDDKAYSIIETKDGGYIVAGGAGSYDGDIIGNHGGFNDFWIVKLSPETAVDDFGSESNSLSISPNPATENITISFPITEATGITITNSVGMEIKHFTYAELEGQNSLNYSTEGLPSGIYYCTLLSGQERVTKRFVVVK